MTVERTDLSTEKLRAMLFRERVVDDQGSPVDGEVPENWGLVDGLPSELLPLGQCSLQITVADDFPFVKGLLLDGWETGDDVVIRAVLEPPPGELPRMGDIVAVMVGDVFAFCYEILVTHGDVPEHLTQEGEMCLALRTDLGAVYAAMTGENPEG